MSKKAPDTRGKLESVKTGKKTHKPKRFKNTKQLADIVKANTPDAIKLKLEKKPTKGELFKQKNGISKTQKRLLHKYGLETVAEYKPIRKARKQKETKARQEKHKASVTYKRLNGKGKKGAKNQPVKKEAKK